MFSIRILALIFVMLSPVPNGRVVQEAHSEKIDPLSKPVKDYQDVEYDLPSALNSFAQRCGVPTGLEIGPPMQHHPISVRIAQGTTADLLNAILNQEPGYMWANINGVVNVFPVAHSDTILDIWIQRFRVRNADSSRIQATIDSLPEVKKWLKDNKLTASTPTAVDIIIGKNGYTTSRVSLDLHGVTLREILNAILRSRGFHYWMVGRWGANNQYLSLGVH